MVSASLRGHKNINSSVGVDKQNGLPESWGRCWVGMRGLEQWLLTNQVRMISELETDLVLPVFTLWLSACRPRE